MEGYKKKKNHKNKMKKKEQEEEYLRTLKALNSEYSAKLQGIKKGPEQEKIHQSWREAKANLAKSYNNNITFQKNKSSKSILSQKKSTLIINQEEEEEEISIEEFLNKPVIRAHPTNPIFNWNLKKEENSTPGRLFNFIPPTPIFHFYHFPWVLAPIAARLPQESMKNLPTEIHQCIQNLCIEQPIDFFFVAQAKDVLGANNSDKSNDDKEEKETLDTISLKAWPWMFESTLRKNNITNLNDIKGSPNELKKQVQLGIFGLPLSKPSLPNKGEEEELEDSSIKKQSEGKSSTKKKPFPGGGGGDKFISNHNNDGEILQSFRVNLHGGRVSPNNAHVSIQEFNDVSISFYSICYFREEKRCAITLHWLLTPKNYSQLNQSIIGICNDDHCTIGDMIHVMTQEATWLKEFMKDLLTILYSKN